MARIAIRGHRRHHQGRADSKHLDELEKLPPDKLRAAAQYAHRQLRRVQRSRQLNGVMAPDFASKTGPDLACSIPSRKLIELAGPEAARRRRLQRRRRFHRARAPAGRSNAASSAACGWCTSITGCRPRAASGAGIARGRRATWRVPFVSLAREHRTQARRIARSRGARCALRAARAARWSPAKCWSPPNIATTRSKPCCCSCFAAPVSPGSPACRAIAPFGPGRIARPLLRRVARRNRSRRAQSDSCAGSKTHRTPTRASRAISCASDCCR